MKLETLTKKPQLIEVTVDDAEIVAEYGEAITFWTWDRQPLTIFTKLAAIDGKNTNLIVDAVKELVLDEHGKQIITDETALPVKIMMAVITKVIETLGK